MFFTRVAQLERFSRKYVTDSHKLKCIICDNSFCEANIFGIHLKELNVNITISSLQMMG